MAIVLESEVDALTPGLRFDLERRLGRVCRKASKLVKEVSVNIKEVAPGKGGLTKQCRLILTLAGAPSLTIVARHKAIEKAYLEALRLADSALSGRKKAGISHLYKQVA